MPAFHLHTAMAAEAPSGLARVICYPSGGGCPVGSTALRARTAASATVEFAGIVTAVSQERRAVCK
jgi:hypothetical protein